MSLPPQTSQDGQASDPESEVVVEREEFKTQTQDEASEDYEES